MSAPQLAALDQARDFSKSRDGEIERSWLGQVIVADYRQEYPRLEEFLSTVGEVNLLTPLYEQLMKTDSGATLAKRVYKKARPGYDPTTVAVLDPILDLPAESSE